MKKIIRHLALLAALTLLGTLLTACGGTPVKTGEEKAADTLAAIRERGVLIVATEGTWAPLTYHDETNALTGFDVEMARYIAAKLGVDVRFEETEWDSILAGVEAGRFDLACNGVSYTEERAQAYTFSAPYVYTDTVIVTRSDNDAISSLEDLAGKTTANTASSTYAGAAEEAGASVVPVDALIDTLNLVIDGRVDATLNARSTIEAYLEAHSEAPLKIAGSAPEERYVIPMKKGPESDALAREIDRILEGAREDGTLSDLSVRFLGADLTRPGGAQ